MAEIRPYRDSDYEEVKRNLQEGEMFDGVWDRRENLSKMIAGDPESILVVVENGLAIGNVYLIMCGWEGFIFRLAVRNSHRNSGIGSQLLAEAEGRMKKKGIEQVALFVDAAEGRLHGFYRQRGYSMGAKPYMVMWKEV